MNDKEFIDKLKRELSKKSEENTEEYTENEIDKVNLDSKNIFDNFQDSQIYQKKYETQLLLNCILKTNGEKELFGAL